MRLYGCAPPLLQSFFEGSDPRNFATIERASSKRRSIFSSPSFLIHSTPLSLPTLHPLSSTFIQHASPFPRLCFRPRLRTLRRISTYSPHHRRTCSYPRRAGRARRTRSKEEDYKKGCEEDHQESRQGGSSYQQTLRFKLFLHR